MGGLDSDNRYPQKDGFATDKIKNRQISTYLSTNYGSILELWKVSSGIPYSSFWHRWCKNIIRND